MTPLLIASLLAAEPGLVTSEQFRARFAALNERRAAIEARREALPWLQGGAAVATTLVAIGVLWGVVGLMNPDRHSPVPLPAVFGVSAFNLISAIVLGALVSQLEEVVEEDAAAVEREAERLRALHRRQAGAL